MKAVILAGGLGTRISEESDLRPKPMVEIGGLPILWHVMKIYSTHGIKEFIVCLGYKGYVVKDYFYNYYKHTSNVSIDLATGDHVVLDSASEDWKITFIDTGLDTQTGGRIRKIRKYLGEETFCLTYGDGVSNIDISAEIQFHRDHGKLATVAAVRPPGRFATLSIDPQGNVDEFREKHIEDSGWINGGFFILEPSVIDFIQDDSTSWEGQPLEELARTKNLAAFKHYDFWKPMDTLRDKRELDLLCQRGEPPWLVEKKNANL